LRVWHRGTLSYLFTESPDSIISYIKWIFYEKFGTIYTTG